MIKISRRSLLVSIGLMIVLLSVLSSADPAGPNSIDRSPSQRYTIAGGSSQQESTGGNVTPLKVNGDRVTQRWQGYFGNVTGGILLADSAGNNLYQWGLVNPSGEIFASNGSGVSWTRIDCINFSANPTVFKYNITELNNFIGYTTDIQQAAEDTFNTTFNQTFGNDGSTFTIGARTFVNADNCSMTTLNINNAYQTTDFREVLLTDNESIIFTALLESNANGFNNIPADFEMLVAVNGSDGTPGTVRNYFFYVELS